MDLTATISWPELAWTVACLVGLGVTLGELREVGRDRAALDRLGAPHPAWEIVARAHAWGERIRSAVLGLFALVGLYAMTQPPSPLAPSWGQLVSLGAFVASAVLMAAGALLDRSVRRRLAALEGWDGDERRKGGR